MNNSIFRIDWDKLIRLFIPIKLRNTLIIWFVWSVLYPLKQLHQLFINFRQERLNRLSYNSQVVYLQKMLNDEFDPFSRSIRIMNNSIDDRRLFYYQHREKPMYFGKHYFYTNNWTRNYDFLVIIPTDLFLTDVQIIQLKNLIEYYKLYSKNYEIRYESR